MGNLGTATYSYFFYSEKNIFEPEPMKAGARDNRQMQRKIIDVHAEF